MKPISFSIAGLPLRGGCRLLPPILGILRVLFPKWRLLRDRWSYGTANPSLVLCGEAPTMEPFSLLKRGALELSLR